MSNVNKKTTITAFCCWEFNRIGLNIEIDNNLLPIDLTLEEAKKLRDELFSAILSYEEMEKSCEEYFKNEKEENKDG